LTVEIICSRIFTATSGTSVVGVVLVVVTM
jgi:hypothetical protein